MPELVDRMLDASGADLAAGKLGCIRQITISTPTDWTAQHVWRAGRQVE